jgi:hypothetical protein
MNDQPERPTIAVSVPMNSGAGMSPSVGVAAPIGAVSRKDRERAGRTSLRREGTSNVLLDTALPGRVILQRRGADGTWETVHTQPASHLGSTRIELPHEAAPLPPTFRVVFSPKNTNINSWISEDIDG